MSSTAVVENGKIVETASQSSTKKAAGKSGMDKDAFLQLLVAQMKYQDPLEPTSNTEYISQYATFSQVEQIQNMAATMELSRASSMVGKVVEIRTMTSTGDYKSVQGSVEYVTYENGKAYVSVDGALYSADDVVAMIAGLAATEVQGVAAMAGNISNELMSKMGVKNLARGVRVEVIGKRVKAELALIVEYGYNIPAISQRVQEKVKSTAENMTGLEVSDVDIRIAGVCMQKEK